MYVCMHTYTTNIHAYILYILHTMSTMHIIHTKHLYIHTHMYVCMHTYIPHTFIQINTFVCSYKDHRYIYIQTYKHKSHWLL